MESSPVSPAGGKSYGGSRLRQVLPVVFVGVLAALIVGASSLAFQESALALTIQGETNTPVVTFTSGATSIEMNWEPLAGADRYRYRYRRGKGAWSAATHVTGLSATISKLSTGQTYAVAVGARVNGKWSPDWAQATLVVAGPATTTTVPPTTTVVSFTTTTAESTTTTTVGSPTVTAVVPTTSTSVPIPTTLPLTTAPVTVRQPVVTVPAGTTTAVPSTTTVPAATTTAPVPTTLAPISTTTTGLPPGSIEAPGATDFSPTVRVNPAVTSLAVEWSEVVGATSYQYRYRIKQRSWSGWQTVVGPFEINDLASATAHSVQIRARVADRWKSPTKVTLETLQAEPPPHHHGPPATPGSWLPVSAEQATYTDAREAATYHVVDPYEVDHELWGATRIGWLVKCDSVKFDQIDPIAQPGVDHGHHMHEFFGNPNVDPNTTTQSLFDTPLDDIACTDRNDKSAYWSPVVYQDGWPIQASSISIYYKSTTPDVVPMPDGLRMIAGNAGAEANESSELVGYWMTREPSTEEVFSSIGATEMITPHRSGVPLMLRMNYPNCWDGVHLDSPDHQSHMAYFDEELLTCPTSHPVKIPQVTTFTFYDDIDGGAGLALASGPWYTFHQDFWNAWSPEQLAELNQLCNVDGNNCRTNSTAWLQDKGQFAKVVPTIEPWINDPGPLEVPENSTAVTKLVAFDDVDAAASLTFSLAGPDAGRFAVSPAGEVSFADVPDFETPGDADADNRYEVQVVATDSDGLTGSRPLVITVIDVLENTVPTFVTDPQTTTTLPPTTTTTLPPTTTTTVPPTTTTVPPTTTTVPPTTTVVTPTTVPPTTIASTTTVAPTTTVPATTLPPTTVPPTTSPLS